MRVKLGSDQKSTSISTCGRIELRKKTGESYLNFLNFPRDCQVKAAVFSLVNRLVMTNKNYQSLI